MKLSMIERLVVASVLPTSGNFITVSTALDLKIKLQPDKIEQTSINMREGPNGSLAWDNEKSEDKDVLFSDAERDMVTKAFKDMDRDGKLTAEHISSYKKFMIEPKESE